MPTPFESAQLILSLYETRREETMRKARDFFFGFEPRTFEELIAAMMGPQGGYVRMVISYWDMAASFVENGAIDRKMFLDANGEFVPVFAKIEPFLAPAREMLGNNFAANLEAMIMSLPDARERIDTTRARMNAIRAALAAKATA